MHILKNALKPASSCRLPRRSDAERGFSLAELAVVLLVLTLLAAGSLLPLSSRLQASQQRLTRDQLDEIELALVGHALIYGQLPCPSPPSAAGGSADGIAPAPPCDFSQPGELPWRSLGVGATDAWGQRWRYQVDAGFAEAQIQATTLPRSNLQVFDHQGLRLTLVDSQAVALVFSLGANRHGDGRNASHNPAQLHYQSGEEQADFDDLLRWLGRPLLLARLAQGGRL
ncbi:MAG: prepilin-type N-terminal cleavage/methylation domain-containing protein [Thauera sp.]|jgi:prepilin-type N-terminal cleavage/methylation domain-containing protein|nr:prepilin-type N-terminal cleavage/methylation domain-containing protein [Thauera sp.]